MCPEMLAFRDRRLPWVAAMPGPFGSAAGRLGALAAALVRDSGRRPVADPTLRKVGFKLRI